MFLKNSSSLATKNPTSLNSLQLFHSKIVEAFLFSSFGKLFILTTNKTLPLGFKNDNRANTISCYCEKQIYLSQRFSFIYSKLCKQKYLIYDKIACMSGQKKSTSATRKCILSVQINGIKMKIALNTSFEYGVTRNLT